MDEGPTCHPHIAFFLLISSISHAEDGSGREGGVELASGSQERCRPPRSHNRKRRPPRSGGGEVLVRITPLLGRKRKRRAGGGALVEPPPVVG